MFKSKNVVLTVCLSMIYFGGLAQNKGVQNAIPFLAKVTSSRGNIVGVLYRVTDSSVTIVGKEKVTIIAPNDIYAIKIKRRAKNEAKYKPLKFIETSTVYDTGKTYWQNQKEGFITAVTVNAAYVGGQLATQVFKNSFKGGIFGCIEKFDFKNNPKAYIQQRSALERYTVDYQKNTSLKKQLIDLKEITNQFQSEYGIN